MMLLQRRILPFFCKMYGQSCFRGIGMLNEHVSSVLDFWFMPGESMQAKSKLWFFGDSEVDAVISKRFGHLVEKARSGELVHWESHPKSALAHIILIDQFCRNIFRGKPESFSHDHVALRIAKELVSRGKEGHRSLAVEERCFVYLPYEHSEDIEDQVKSVELYTELLQDTANEDYHNFVKNNLDFAIQHKTVIEKFGRFPKRNIVLGRTNTPEEEEFLANNPYGF